jgi:hypothetical protein
MRRVLIRSGLASGLVIVCLCIPTVGRAEPVTILGHKFFCCPITFTYSRPPCIKYKTTCGKPICDPCLIEHDGYYPTCWRPWTGRTDCPCPNAPPIVLAPKSTANNEPDQEELAPPPTLKPMKEPLKEPEKNLLK